MISSTHRFHGRASLTYVYRRGRTVRGPVMAMRYVHDEKRHNYRVAVVVSKKVSKKAVVRNRIRRRVFEAIRGLEPKLSPHVDIVITIFNESLATMPFTDVEKMVYAQLRQADAIAKSVS